ncbi:Ribophorin I [Penicillium coprophilum]|uniref:Ribophorin I n=1 Tax=Penicillium coprophilum TaxID=36646 RepID=UPI00238C96AF|nr:Ribophorin I [Penicillium coprophilum]KAJ5169282.1 Ribophorin I [Penicillium coprophilum]
MGTTYHQLRKLPKVHRPDTITSGILEPFQPWRNCVLQVLRMRFFTATVLGLLAPSLCAATNLTTPSRLDLPSGFKPPQVFKNTNLVRNTNLEKSYVRETINVVVENIDKQPHNDYYIPFPAEVFDRVAGFEVRDKKALEKGRFDVDYTEAVSSDGNQYFVIHLPEPLAPKSQITLGISYSVLSSLSPLPATIGQADKQYLTYSFSAYMPSAYTTNTQKTKLKFPSTNVPDYTTTDGLKSGSDPERKGATYTYGPYDTAKVAPGTQHPITVRYEFTKPVISISLLERDLEVSHWGGNLATEERYWLRNNGSKLTKQFSRVEWTFANYQQAPTSAVRELTYPLLPGSVDPYFIDDIGNVSTSRYRPSIGKSAGSLELKPRYPIFGGWNYSFRIGWNNDLASFLRRAAGVNSDTYVLKAPLIEGPKMAEGIQYERVVVRVVLPEGAHNVRFEILEGTNSNGLPGVNHIHAHLSSLKTYMDTLGRTTLTLEVDSLTDEARDSKFVVTYDYSMFDALRKPLTIFAGMLTVFVAAWGIGKIDISIKKRRFQGISPIDLYFLRSTFLHPSQATQQLIAMLQIKQSPDKSRPPPVEDNTHESPSKLNLSPPRNPLGPAVVYIARATNKDDHNYNRSTWNNDEMHAYLRGLLVIAIAEHRKRFGILGLRPPKMQTIIQPAHTRISSVSRIGKFLALAMEEARASKSECIFVLNGWDGWTTDKMTIVELCDQFRDVPLTLHVYANRGTPCEFFEVNAHKVNAYLRNLVSAEDPSIVGDRATALYIRILEALPALHNARYHPAISQQEKDALAKYDKRFAGIYELDESEIPKVEDAEPEAPKPGV